MAKKRTSDPVYSDVDIADLKNIAKRIRGFMGSPFENAECEVIVVQTLHGSLANLKRHGRAFSFEEGDLRAGRQKCGTDNARGLNRLIAGDYLVEVEHEGRPALMITRKLIDLMKGYLAKP